MEIRAEDCLMGIGYRDLKLDGYYWTELDLEAIGISQWIGFVYTLGLQ